MNRTRFEERLVRHANDAHTTCRAQEIPALIGVPAYLTGVAIGSVILTVANLRAGRWPR